MKLSIDDIPGKEFTDEHGTFTFIELVGEKNMAAAYVRDDSIYTGRGLEIARRLVDRFNAEEGEIVDHELFDVYDDADTPTITATVKATGRGISISLKGFGNLTGDAEVVLIENVEGTPKVVIWGDKNKEDPTDIIPLEGAKLDASDEG